MASKLHLPPTSKVEFHNPFAMMVAAVVVGVVTGDMSNAQGQSAAFELAPIRYQETPVNDRVAQLASALAEGQARLSWDDEHGYLKSILQELEVPISSQTLVFSKTSLQLHRISPQRPRAVYFNDDVYVGWCQNGDVIEIAATDPQQGAIFYTIDQTQDQPAEVVRDRGQCMSCHASSRTQGVPGYLVRSVFSDPAGYPKFGGGTFLTDHTSDFQERWGGWYVTGTHGSMRHMGNQVCEGSDQEPEIDREAGANLETLDGLLQTDRYLSPHSDIVALMVMEHQTQMHNAITAANFETRRAIYQSKQMNELLDRPADLLSESALRRIDKAAANVVKYLLMSGEFALRDPVKGTSNYSSEFQSLGRRDSRGRWLRDRDLQTRLFRYPCSYLIHSPAFDALPDEVRTRILDRLLGVLDGSDDSEEFTHLDRDTRQQILAILRATKPEFAQLADRGAAPGETLTGSL